jgi:hypothetical protein
MLAFRRRYGFINEEQKYIGFLYEEISSGRQFSVVCRMGDDIMYINELDETCGPNDNTYSTITAQTLNEAKNLINGILQVDVCANLKEDMS